MSITYVPPTLAGETIGPHEVLRVTFAEGQTPFLDDTTLTANLAFDIQHLMTEIESGGYPVVPVSDPTVPPGAMAVTIDFMPPGQGTVSVASVLERLTNGLFGVLQFLHNTSIVRVEKITAAQAGAAEAGSDRAADTNVVEQTLANTALGATLSRVFGTVTVGVIVIGAGVLAIMYAPEIKAALVGPRKLAEHV